jgi:hypothetical protein
MSKRESILSGASNFFSFDAESKDAGSQSLNVSRKRIRRLRSAKKRGTPLRMFTLFSARNIFLQ